MEIAILKKELLGMPAGTILAYDELDNSYYRLDVVTDASDNKTEESSTYISLGADMVRSNTEYFDLSTAIEEKEEQVTQSPASTMRSEEELRAKLVEIEYTISKLVEMQQDFDNESIRGASKSVIDSLRKRYWTISWVLGETDNID